MLAMEKLQPTTHNFSLSTGQTLQWPHNEAYSVARQPYNQTDIPEVDLIYVGQSGELVLIMHVFFLLFHSSCAHPHSNGKASCITR